MIVLIGALLVMMMQQLRSASSDARLARQQLQLRQLLHAGAAAAPALVTDPRPSLELALPAHLAQQGGWVSLHQLPAPNQVQLLIEVRAGYQNRTAKQRLVYAKSNLGWGLVEARLVP